jgi:hypothetical protein
MSASSIFGIGNTPVNLLESVSSGIYIPAVIIGTAFSSVINPYLYAASGSMLQYSNFNRKHRVYRQVYACVSIGDVTSER